MADPRDPRDPRAPRQPEAGKPATPPPPGPPLAATDGPARSVVPAPAGSSGLDRLAVERVLARASELQAGSADGGLLSESQILDVGREVGLTPAALRQALAEERTRVTLPGESGWAARTFGPALASASRTIVGSPRRAMELLELWMAHDECLTVKRRFTDRTTWEPRRDLLGSVRRWLNLGGRGYALMEAHEVAATIVPVDAERVLVRLDADLSAGRRNRLRLGGATAAAGVVTGGALAVAGAMVAVPTAAAVIVIGALAALPTAAGLGGGYAIARQHEGTAVRVQLALEQLLDRLEHEPPTRGTVPPFIERLLG